MEDRSVFAVFFDRSIELRFIESRSLKVFDFHFIFPGDPNTLTGGFIFDKRIVNGLSQFGWRIGQHVLMDGFPFPRVDAAQHASEIIKNIPDNGFVVIDGLALAPLVNLIDQHADRLVVIALIHHPLAEETGISAVQQSRFKAQERRVLGMCARVLVTSSATATKLVSDYAVDADRIGVVEPGVDAASFATGSGSAHTKLICVGTLTPRKGHELLLNSLAPLRNHSWSLSCIGDLERDAVTAVRVHNCARKLGLEDRVTFWGAVNQSKLARQYHSSDLFVLASHYEGYGMALAEALAHGVPVIATGAGAIVNTVPSRASLLVPPGNVAALTKALGRFFGEPRLRRQLKAGARASRLRQRSWDSVIHDMADEVRSLVKP